MILFIFLFDLIFIYLHKYIFKNLSLNEFHLFRIGNLLNLALFLAPALGLIILYFNPKKIEKARYYVLITLLIAINLLILGYLIASVLKFRFPPEYLFEYPAEKVYTAALFVLLGILIIVFSIFIWFSIFKISSAFYFKVAGYSLIVILILIVFAFVFSSNFIRSIDFSTNNIRKADVAVVLGAAVWSGNKPSPILASRINKAGELYNKGIVKKIQVTGGKAPGEISEARVAYYSLVKEGVNPPDIWIEESTASTSDQIAYIKKILIGERNLKNILVVSDQVHLKRVLEICKFYNIRVKGVASDLQLSWDKSILYRFRDSIALLLFWLFAI